MAIALTPGQTKFISTLAGQTGLDPHVIAAWATSEENGSAAQQREAQGNHNWLNIGYFDSGPGGITKAQAFHNPVTAAEQTAKFLRGQWGGASSGIRSILNSVRGGPNAQIQAIGSSGWATDPNYGRNIQSLYGQVRGAHFNVSADQPQGRYLAGVPGTPGQPAQPAVDNTGDALISALLNTGKVEDLTKTTGKIGGGLLSSASGILDQLNAENPPTAGSPAVPSTPGTSGMYLGANGSAAGSAGTVSPFAHASNVQRSRTDQGVDFAFRGPMGSIGPGVITSVKNFQGFGTTIEETLNTGQKIYVALETGGTPSVHAGQHVGAGQEIARGSGTGGIEIGFAGDNGLPVTPYGSSPHNTYNQGGHRFSQFLKTVGVGGKEYFGGGAGGGPSAGGPANHHFVTFGMSH